MSLPNPKAQIIHSSFNLVASNNVEGQFYQFGVYGGYAMRIAYHCTTSKEIALHQLEENSTVIRGPFDYMKFWGFGPIDAVTQARILSSGIDPEDLHINNGPLESVKLEEGSACVVFISLDNAEDVTLALRAVEPALQVGTVIIMNKWWKTRHHTRMGFDRWVDRYVPLKDFDNYLEVFQDNGWARAFVVRKLANKS